jgi:hypothetical protein
MEAWVVLESKLKCFTAYKKDWHLKTHLKNFFTQLGGQSHAYLQLRTETLEQNFTSSSSPPRLLAPFQLRLARWSIIHKPQMN